MIGAAWPSGESEFVVPSPLSWSNGADSCRGFDSHADRRLQQSNWKEDKIRRLHFLMVLTDQLLSLKTFHYVGYFLGKFLVVTAVIHIDFIFLGQR